MWKTKRSKFASALPKYYKRDEWVTGVSGSNLPKSCSNHVQCSVDYVICQSDNAGPGNLVVIPYGVNKPEDPVKGYPTITAHTDVIMDFAVCPCADHLLATCASDGSVKVWSLPTDPTGFASTLTSPLATLPSASHGVNCIRWNPTVDGVLAAAAEKHVLVYDVNKEVIKYNIEGHAELVQSLSWKFDGSTLVTSSKDKKLRLLDPRNQAVSQETSSHGNAMDSRVVWLGNSPYIVSTGFNSMRTREISLRDSRNLFRPVHTVPDRVSSKVFIPLYDQDTNMLFLAAKGEPSLLLLEVVDSSPWVYEGSQIVPDAGQTVQGVGLVPKQVLDVMSCEVDRLMVLTDQAIIPLTYTMVKKTYSEFHADVFPETLCREPSLTVDEWERGELKLPNKMSLSPAVKQSQAKTKPNSPQEKPAAVQMHKPAGDGDKQAPATDDVPSPLPSHILGEKKTPRVLAGVRHSKFRHMLGAPAHRSQHIENLRNLSSMLPAESDMFQANSTLCALPLGGPGGNILVLRTDFSGRLSDTGLPFVHNRSTVLDFVFDPFNDQRLAVGCEDGVVRIWHLPAEGLVENLSEPQMELKGHTERVTILKFHPLARDVLASAAFDLTVKLWSLNSEQAVITLLGHTEPISSLSWSLSGRQCVTFTKDGALRVYEPRKSQDPVKVCETGLTSHAGRVTWACQDKLLIISAFSARQRHVSVFWAGDPVSAVFSLDLGSSPSVLVPFYDHDSSTLFLTSRGDSLVSAFEVLEDYPHLTELSDVQLEGLHQAFAFLPKRDIDVKQVEFARALRLTQNSIMPVAFKVPRVKTDLFQDDLFPDTRVTWEPALSSDDWFSGQDGEYKKISLRPEHMKQVSDVAAPSPQQVTSSHMSSLQRYEETYKTDDQKKEELLNAVHQRLGEEAKPLPQDLMEGVDDDEWDD